MGSSTRCCAKPLDPLRRRLLFALGALPLGALGLLTNDGTAVADAASRARLWRDGEGNWFLDADLGFERFPAVWEDLLQRGIAMPLRLELMLYRERWYWSDQLVFGKFWRITIRHQPVTQDWLLTVGDATQARIFAMRAREKLDKDTPEWRRATDIVLTSNPSKDDLKDLASEGSINRRTQR